MINTYNESSLHKTLKELYALNESAQTEVLKNNHIYDIFKNDGTIIEIQTKNLGKLYAKIKDSLNLGHKCTIVHPIAIQTIIITKDKDENILSKRKSPKKNSIYSIFRELTGIYPLLLENNFKLEILETIITEERIKTEIPVQSKNKQRRFKKDWNKSDKKLNEILNTRIFETKNDYLKLLPEGLSEEFTTKEIQTLLKQNKTLPKSASNYASLMVWVFNKMELIEQTGTKNRFKTYRIK